MFAFLVSLNDLLPSSDINTGIEETTRGLKSILEQILEASSFITSVFNLLPEYCRTIFYVSIAIGVIIGLIKVAIDIF